MRDTLRNRILWLYHSNRAHDPKFVSADPKTYEILGHEPIADFIRVERTPTNLYRGFILVGERGWVLTEHVSFPDRAPPVIRPDQWNWFKSSDGRLLHLTKQDNVCVHGVSYGNKTEWRQGTARAETFVASQDTAFHLARCHPVMTHQIWAPPVFDGMPLEVVGIQDSFLHGRMVPRVTLASKDPYGRGLPIREVWLPDLYLQWHFAVITPAEAAAVALNDIYTRLQGDDIL